MTWLQTIARNGTREGFGHVRPPRYRRVLPPDVLQAMLIVAVVAVAASAIHAPHWPDMLFGMHEPTAMVEHSMLAGLTGGAFHTAHASAEDVWCSVEAVAPGLFQILLTLLAASLVLAITVLAPTIGLVQRRTKPPPLVGGRLRATLQVFRN